jgi:hypothetical protein
MLGRLLPTSGSRRSFTSRQTLTLYFLLDTSSITRNAAIGNYSTVITIVIQLPIRLIKTVDLKVHMHEIFIVCFKNFFCIFQSPIDIKHSTANIFENILEIRPDIRSFRSLAVFAESAKHG